MVILPLLMDLFFRRALITISDCTFNDCFDSTNGAAIEIIFSNLTVNLSTFYFCGGRSGGALSTESSNVTITLSNFTQNYAEGDAGAFLSGDDFVVLSEVAFNSNSADLSGAFYSVGSTIFFDRAFFIFNQAESITSTLFLRETNGLISNCLFGNNTLFDRNPFYNTCVFISQPSQDVLTFLQCTFLFNTYSDDLPGSDIYVSGTANITISTCVFSSPATVALPDLTSILSDFNSNDTSLLLAFPKAAELIYRKRIPVGNELEVNFIVVSFAISLLLIGIVGFVLRK